MIANNTTDTSNCNRLLQETLGLVVVCEVGVLVANGGLVLVGGLFIFLDRASKLEELSTQLFATAQQANLSRPIFSR